MGNGAAKPETPKSEESPKGHVAPTVVEAPSAPSSVQELSAVINGLNDKVTQLCQRIVQLEEENSSYRQQFHSLATKTGAGDERISEAVAKLSELAMTIADVRASQEVNSKQLGEQLKNVENMVATQQRSPSPSLFPPIGPTSQQHRDQDPPLWEPPPMELLPQSRFPQQDFRNKSKTSRETAQGAQNTLQEPSALGGSGPESAVEAGAPYNELMHTKKYPTQDEQDAGGQRPSGTNGPRQGFV